MGNFEEGIGIIDYIGEINTSFPELQFPGAFYIINQNKTSSIGYKNSGKFIINSCTPAPRIPNEKYTPPLYWSFSFSARGLPLEGIAKSPDPLCSSLCFKYL